jgi:signal transduction histidine kinase
MNKLLTNFLSLDCIEYLIINLDINKHEEIETVCYHKNGKKIHMAFPSSIVQTEVEHFQGYVYILRDMTERKQAELVKQEFLAMISHEIRTPITSVVGQVYY